MKKLLFAGIAVSMLAACSNDEVVPVNNDSNAIKFAAKSENGTRAADIYCSENPFNTFKVFAKYGEAKYIDGDVISGSNETGWENTSGLRYWPNSGNVTFYAHRNGESAFTWANATDVPTFANFKVNQTVREQVDLMYAVKTQSKETASQVDLNFRHALSQVVFQAKNTNENLHVEIVGVSVVNVADQSTYTFPTADTDANLSHPNGVGSASDDSRGTWGNLNAKTASYEVTFDAVSVPGDSEIKPLTTFTNHGKPASNNNQYENAMILMPQTTDALNAGEGTAELNGGSYFLVKCKIWNVVGDEKEDSDLIVWPLKEDGSNGTDETDNLTAANILVPVAFDWKQGMKYTYTFLFGNGGGGYDPTNPGEDPVLVPITFSVDIDEFIPVPKVDDDQDYIYEVEPAEPTTKPAGGEDTEEGGEEA